MSAPGRDASPIVVREARPEELAAAGELVAAVYGAEGFADGPYLDLLRDARRRAAEAELLVAADGDGQIVGTVTYAPGGTTWADTAGPDEAELRMLAVAPAARGRGIGGRLVCACIERARAEGKRRLVLSTQPDMAAAHRLYGRLGFERLPERDWSPEPDLNLRVYAVALDPFGRERGQPAGPEATRQTEGRRCRVRRPPGHTVPP